MATSPRPEVEGEDDEEEEVKATAGRTSFSPSTATDESVAKSSAAGSDGCTAVARSTTGRRKAIFSTLRATRVFKRERDDNGIAARPGERLAFIAVAVVVALAVVVRIIESLVKQLEKEVTEEERQKPPHAGSLFVFTEDVPCVLRKQEPDLFIQVRALRGEEQKKRPRGM